MSDETDPAKPSRSALRRVEKKHSLSATVVVDARVAAARLLCASLQSSGHEACFVGGAVRDLLIAPEVAPNDVDIATSASPEDVAKLFPGSGFVGKSFGVSLVRTPEHAFEVATFRCEGAYSDRRHPDTVRRGTLEEDSRRRDFTINALYFDPVRGLLIDCHGGLGDLAARRLDCVGDARDRLFEDPLRIVRLFRFAVATGFDPSPVALAAVRATADGLRLLSRERVLAEIIKVKPGRAGDFFSKMFALIEPHTLDAAMPAMECDASALAGLAREPLWLREALFHARFPATALAVFLRAGIKGCEVHLFKALEQWPLQGADRELLRLTLALSNGSARVDADDTSTLAVRAFRFQRLLKGVKDATPRELVALMALPGAISDPRTRSLFARAEERFRSEASRAALPMPDFLKWAALNSPPTLPSRGALASLHAEKGWPPAWLGALHAVLEGMGMLGDDIPTEFNVGDARWRDAWAAAAQEVADAGKVHFQGLAFEQGKKS